MSQQPQIPQIASVVFKIRFTPDSQPPSQSIPVHPTIQTQIQSQHPEQRNVEQQTEDIELMMMEAPRKIICVERRNERVPIDKHCQCTKNGGNHTLCAFFAEQRRKNELFPPNKQKKNEVPQRFASYTLEQYTDYYKLTREWKKRNLSQIKGLLRKNGYVLTNSEGKMAKKQELINILADGILLGSIPRCQYCYSHPQLKFNQENGFYYCIGLFNEKRDHLPCANLQNHADVKRGPFNE